MGSSVWTTSTTATTPRRYRRTASSHFIKPSESTGTHASSFNSSDADRGTASGRPPRAIRTRVPTVVPLAAVGCPPCGTPDLAPGADLRWQGHPLSILAIVSLDSSTSFRLMAEKGLHGHNDDDARGGWCCAACLVHNAAARPVTGRVKGHALSLAAWCATSSGPLRLCDSAPSKSLVGRSPLEPHSRRPCWKPNCCGRPGRPVNRWNRSSRPASLRTQARGRSRGRTVVILVPDANHDCNPEE